MESLESALKFYDNEIELHTKKLLQLRETLETLVPLAHDLSVEFATTNAEEIGQRSQEVGNTIANLEREISVLNDYIQRLWNSKINCMESMKDDNDSKIR